MSFRITISLTVSMALTALCISHKIEGQVPGEDVPSIVFSSDSMPQYKTIINARDDELGYSRDSLGNRVPDFSYCGYMASEKPIPDIPVKITVSAGPGDATRKIQEAIDYVSSLPVDESGFRGAILLEKGEFEIGGSLFIRSSGVVLRGSGSGAGGTVLMGTGVDRETLIQVAGRNDRIQGEKLPLAKRYFPLNETELVFESPHPFKEGDRVNVNRPSTKEWLERIGTDRLGVDDFRTHWDPGDFDINWDRTVVAVSPRSITLDAPITNALDPDFGGGYVTKYNWEGRLKNVGVENLHCLSGFDPSNPKDENHRWMAITMNHLCDGWVRRVVAENFVSSAVAVWEGCRRITVEDCKSLSPIGETANYRRYSFQTLGQQVLFQRCYAEYGYHDFSVGFTAPGLNAFVQCCSHMPIRFSGAVGGWATGVMFDKVTIDGGDISFAFRDMDGQGGGWSAANSLCWQCRAAKILLPSPPTANNWSYGSWAQPQGNGNHVWPQTFLKPESLFYDQLEQRTGKRFVESDKILVYESDETTAPSPEMARRMSERSRRPDLLMDEWIDSMIRTYPIRSDLSASIRLEDLPVKETDHEAVGTRAVNIVDGKVVRNGKLVTGRLISTALWRGSTRPHDLLQAGPHLTRYVPGRTGRGLTDDLDTVTARMIRDHVCALSHFPALWYERRRDDHARTLRSDADVWTPFYEQPFSRSGQGEAYDRLSKYDLNRWNPWYWSRLKEFADLADRKGLLLIQEHYLQHNIIEEGAHWVDYPWRSANNINNLGFAEPPHFSGDKRVYMAEEFYDTSNPVRRHFHEEYIRKSLENVKDNQNVIHDIGHEYTGPLHFIQFWLDVIAGWEEKNHKDVLVMLQGTKDVQDAILSDPGRSPVVDIVDIRQWHYREDGTLYAPAGGVSLTQRQYARIFNPGRTSFDQVYRAVDEYRRKYPDKAVISSLGRGGELSGWAVLMAGGSFAPIPAIEDDAFLEMAAGCKSYIVNHRQKKEYVLEKEGEGYIIFSQDPEVNVEFCDRQANYRLKWIDPATGKILDHEVPLPSGGLNMLRSPFEGASVAWLTVL